MLILQSVIAWRKKYPRQKGVYGIFNDSFPPIMDGVTLTVENYARYLALIGKTPCVVTPWNPEKVDCEYDVMRYFSLPITSRHPYRYGYPKLDPFIWNRISNTDFAIVHSHCPFSSGRLAVYAKKKHDIPLIGTFHSKYRTDLEHSFRHAPWFVSIIMKRILDFFYACDEVWIPQAQVEETVREYGFKGKLTVVPNGNDYVADGEESLENRKRRSREKLGFSEDEFILLFVGQHIWEKGIGKIAEALELLPKDMKFRMNFIGNGYALDPLRKLIKEKNLDDKVKIHGIIRDRAELYDYYLGSDLFLFPSMYDNAPLVVREAAVCGTPAVVPVGSTASEVIVDSNNGFLCPDDSVELAKKIKELSANRLLVRKVGVNAGNTLVRSWEDVVAEVADRYRVILANYKK